MYNISLNGISFHQFPFDREEEMTQTRVYIRTNEGTSSSCKKIEKDLSPINTQKSSDLELISLTAFANEISQKRGYQPIESSSSQKEIFASSNFPKHTNHSHTDLRMKIIQAVSKEMQKEEKGNYPNIKEESFLELCSLKSFAEELIKRRNQNF